MLERDHWLPAAPTGAHVPVKDRLVCFRRSTYGYGAGCFGVVLRGGERACAAAAASALQVGGVVRERGRD